MLNALRAVWVLAEQKAGRLQDVSLELVCEGCKIADKLGGGLDGVIAGSNIAELAPPLIRQIRHGTDKVRLVDSPLLASYCPEFYTDALPDLIQANH